jgi:hypothetical protein
MTSNGGVHSPAARSVKVAMGFQALTSKTGSGTKFEGPGRDGREVSKESKDKELELH